MSARREEAAALGVTVALCACGLVSSQSEAAAAWLSTAFAWLLGVAGGVVLLVWLVREVLDVMRDLAIFGPPDLGLRRRKVEEEESEDVPR